MKEPMKNILKAEVLTLKEQIEYQDGQVVSKTLAQNPAVKKSAPMSPLETLLSPAWTA